MEIKTDAKKVLLIYPPTGFYMRDDRCQAPVEGMTAQPARAPLDLAYMAAVLEKEGHVCIIKDYPAERLVWKDFCDDLRRFSPDVLVISITTPTLEEDLKACKMAKAYNGNILTVSKGAHYAEKDEEVLARHPYLDIVIRGESEFTIDEILKMSDISKVAGVTYRDDGKILKTDERSYLLDLDLLPFPARHLMNNKLYLTPDTKEMITLIYTGRGCPHRCIYCGVGVASGYKMRMRSPKNIVDEIEECVKIHKIRNFFFRADTFTWDEDWVVEICQLIIDRKLKIRWGTNSRVDTISEKRLEWMKKAGCWIIGFGIESGNQHILDKMKKKATLEQAQSAVGLCRKHRIKSYLLFMIGLPWETKREITDTIKFAEKLEGDFVDFNIAYPLPGTEFYKIAKQNNLFNESHLFRGDYSKPITRTFSLSAEELAKLRRKAILSFYLRPKYIFKTLMGIRSPKVLTSYIRSGFRLLLDFSPIGISDARE